MTPRLPSAVLPDSPTGFTGALRDRVFALLFTAEIQSLIGDQLARVALSVLVYEATGSAPATAATYAATLLPAVVGGIVLGRLGDRWPRRHVMLGCEVFRALCFGLLVVPGVPLAVMIVLVVVAVVAGPVFSASEVSALSDRLSADGFRAANGLRMIATQAAQIIGFVCGGILVGAIGARSVLAVDAATFVVSAGLVYLAGRDLVRQPGRRDDVSAICSTAHASDVSSAPAAPNTPGAPGDRPWRNPLVRRLVGLMLLVGFFVVPEGLAVPISHDLDAGSWVVGVLLAAGALGGVLGAAFIVTWVRPAQRARVASRMALMCGVPLLVTPLTDLWPVIAAAWFVSGFLAAFVVEVTSTVVRMVPDAVRASFVGTSGALLLASQSFGLILFGVVALWVSPGVSVAIAGLTGSGLVIAMLGNARRPRISTETGAVHIQVDVKQHA